MSRFFCKTNPIDHSTPLIPKGLYCLDEDICDYVCDYVDEQYAMKGVACANPDLGLKQNDITTNDGMMKDFGRLEVTTQTMDMGDEKLRLIRTNNGHVGNQGRPWINARIRQVHWVIWS
jgi:hypothetical protein